MVLLKIKSKTIFFFIYDDPEKACSSMFYQACTRTTAVWEWRQVVQNKFWKVDLFKGGAWNFSLTPFLHHFHGFSTTFKLPVWTREDQRSRSKSFFVHYQQLSPLLTRFFCTKWPFLFNLFCMLQVMWILWQICSIVGFCDSTTIQHVSNIQFTKWIIQGADILFECGLLNFHWLYKTRSICSGFSTCMQHMQWSSLSTKYL